MGNPGVGLLIKCRQVDLEMGPAIPGNDYNTQTYQIHLNPHGTTATLCSALL